MLSQGTWYKSRRVNLAFLALFILLVPDHFNSFANSAVHLWLLDFTKENIFPRLLLALETTCWPSFFYNKFLAHWILSHAIALLAKWKEPEVILGNVRRYFVRKYGILWKQIVHTKAYCPTNAVHKKCIRYTFLFTSI